MRVSRLARLLARSRDARHGQLVQARTFSLQYGPLRAEVPSQAKTAVAEPVAISYIPSNTLRSADLTLELLKSFAENMPVFLRDACQCEVCVDPSSHQRDFNFTEIPQDIKVDRLELDPKTKHWTVTWTNDIPGYDNHISKYSERDLDQLLFNKPVGISGRRFVSVWNAEIFRRETQDFDYEALLNDDTTLRTALSLIARHGLVFVGNVPKDESAAMNLVTRLTGLYRNTFYGQSWDVRSVPQAKNVAYTSKVLDFHMDLLYMKEPPGLQILHCLENTCTGGESEFVDAFKALDTMKINYPDHTRALSSPGSRIRYGYNNHPHFYSDSKEVVKLKPKGRAHEPKWQVKHANDGGFINSIERVYWSPPFVNTIAPFMQPSSPEQRAHANGLDERWFSATKIFAKLLRTPEFVYETKLPAGTCAVFDNLRVLHARKAFDVNSGKRWLKGVYGDAQDLRNMTRQHVWSKMR